MRTALLVIAACAVGAAETASADPTATVVAEGRGIYQQRDVDALVLIAQRHARIQFSGADEERLRQALARMLVAREALVEATAQLPAAMPKPARDQLLLDVLDYQVALRPESAPTTTTTSPTPSSANGPVLVRLPPLAVTRDLPGGKRRLTLAMALRFPDAAAAKALEDQAPVLQDAILTAVQGLDPALFAQPDQQRIKDALIAAARSKVPAFPADGLLITQMESVAP